MQKQTNALVTLDAPTRNTKNSVGRKGYRGRNWFMTLNNYTLENIQTLSTIKNCLYVFQEEKGKNGTPHLQGHFCFKNPYDMDQVKKLMCKEVHLEPTKNCQAAINYCKKLDTRNGKVYTNMNLKEKVKVGSDDFRDKLDEWIRHEVETCDYSRWNFKL